MTSAPSQFAAVIHDDGGRAASSAAVLIALYALLVALLLLGGGCTPTPVSSAPGVDRAAGTGLQIGDHADAVLRDLKGMQ